MLLNYLIEIKNRVLIVFFAWSFSFLICYLNKEMLLFVLIKLNKNVYNLDEFYFITTNLTDVFQAYLDFAFFICNQFSFFFLSYHLFIFMSPGLFNNEFKTGKKILYYSFFAYIVSGLVYNTVILPYIWYFFSSYQYTGGSQTTISIFFEARLNDYLEFYITNFKIVLIISQLFVVILILLNLVSDKVNFVKSTRKLIYSFILIFATLTSPPDIISQLFLTGLLIFSYELIVLISIIKMCIFTRSKKLKNLLYIVIIIL